MAMSPQTTRGRRRADKSTTIGALALALLGLAGCGGLMDDNVSDDEGMLDSLGGWVGRQYPGVTFVRDESSCELIPRGKPYRVAPCDLATRLPGSSTLIKSKVWAATVHTDAVGFHLATPDFDPKDHAAWDKAADD